MKPHRAHTLPPTAPLSQQVGGHAGVQVTEDESLLLKPAQPREIAFYQLVRDVADASTGLDRLKAWVPRFYGLLSLEGKLAAEPAAEDEVGIASAIVPVDSSAPDSSNGTPSSSDVPGQSLVLQNLLYGYRKPCILDVKLGTVLYDEDTPEEKKARMIKKAAESTSLTTGMRLTGFQVYSTHSPDPIVYGRTYGYSLKPEQLHEGIETFFPCSIPDPETPTAAYNSNAGLPADTIHTLLASIYESLTNLHTDLSAAQLRMVGASVLIIYEGDWMRAIAASGRGGGPEDVEEETAEDDEIDVEVDEHGEIVMESLLADEASSDVSHADPQPRSYTISLIDFAHTRIVPGEGPDQGVLMGMQTLIRLIDRRRQQVAASIESRKS